MNFRRFKALHESGTTYAEIARECGVDYRTVKKYLAADAAVVPATGSPRVGTQPRAITPALEAVIKALLTKDVAMPASVIHERLVSEHGFTGHYQRVKMACRELRPLVEEELDADDEVGRLRGCIGGSRRCRARRRRSIGGMREICWVMAGRCIRSI